MILVSIHSSSIVTYWNVCESENVVAVFIFHHLNWQAAGLLLLLLGSQTHINVCAQVSDNGSKMQINRNYWPLSGAVVYKFCDRDRKPTEAICDSIHTYCDRLWDTEWRVVVVVNRHHHPKSIEKWNKIFRISYLYRYSRHGLHKFFSGYFLHPFKVSWFGK